MVPSDYDAARAGGAEDKDGGVKEVTLEYLLPLSFGPEDLERPRGPQIMLL